MEGLHYLQTFQPRNGKFLSCLHVVCAGCLGECTSLDGSVCCLVCKSSTTAKVVGVELAKQLADISDFLYNGEAHNVETSVAGEWGGRTESADIAFCKICNDMYVEKEASHECADCNGLPLCESHAETHPKKRAYSGHRVDARAGQISSSQPTSSPSSKCCMCHRKSNVVAYCQTCSRCICVECIDAGRHEEHVMESIESAAAKQRTRLAEVIHAAGVGLITTNETIDTAAIADDVTITTTTPTDTFANTVTNNTTDIATPNIGIIMPIGELLSVIERDIETAREKASAASKMATKRLDKIEEMVKQQRERILSDIDHRLWTQLDSLEAKKSRLESLVQRQAAVEEVATRLVSPSVCPAAVLQVANTVVDNLLSDSKDLQAEQTIEPPHVHCVEPATMNGMQPHLEQVVRVHH